MTFGEKLKAVRLEKGMTQQELAKLTDLAQATIADYERGKKYPHLNNLKELARRLHCSPDDLMSDKE